MFKTKNASKKRDIYDSRVTLDAKHNEKIDYFPSSIESDSIKPIYKSFKGWTSKSNHARSFDDLEDNFKIIYNEEDCYFLSK
mgnify:CR=1 FL=1